MHMQKYTPQGGRNDSKIRVHFESQWTSRYDPFIMMSKEERGGSL